MAAPISRAGCAKAIDRFPEATDPWVSPRAQRATACNVNHTLAEYQLKRVNMQEAFTIAEVVIVRTTGVLLLAILCYRLLRGDFRN